MEGWNNLLIILIGFAGLLLLSAVYALFWASRNGQLKDFEEGAKTIFTEEEPEGKVLDSFPGEGSDPEKKRNR